MLSNSFRRSVNRLVLGNSSFGVLPNTVMVGQSRSFSTSSSTSGNEGSKNEQSQGQSSSSNDQQQTKKGLFSTISSTVFAGILVTSTCGYMLYKFGDNMTDEKKYEMSSVEKTIYDNFSQPWREFVDNIFNNLRKYPAFETIFGPAEIHKLLPPPLPKGIGKEYTLVVDIDTISEITTKDKYPTVYKRAGYDYFLTNLSPYYEIILYSNQPNHPKNEQINFKLDPQQSYFSGQLYGDSGLKVKGKFSPHVEMLNRDVKKVIYLDSMPQYEHNNVLSIGKFHPNQREITLIQLVPVLVDIGKKKPDDVRTIIGDLQSKDELGLKIEKYVQENKITTSTNKKK